MKKAFLIRSIIIITVTFSIAVTGKTYKLENLLLTSAKDPVIVSYESETGIDRGFNGIPGIDGIELRIRNTGFDEEDFLYSIRIKPRGLGETRAASRFNTSISSNNKYKQKLLLNVAIYERYLLYVYLVEYKTLHEYYKDLITLYDDRINVMESQAHSEEFKLEQLIKEEKDRTKEWVMCKEIEKNIQVFEQNAKRYLNDTSFANFDTSGLVSIETVMNRLNETNFVLDTNNAYLDYYRNKLELEKARFELEKAESRRYLDMINFRYDNKDMADEIRDKNNFKNYDYKKAFGIELSFQIPNLTNSAADYNRRKASYLSEIEKYNKTKEELDAKVRKDLADLNQLIAQYKYLKARETEVDAEASLKKYLQIEGIDPLVLLDVKENVLKNKIEMAQIKYGILRNYIYVLDNAGKLSDMPIRNYLSEVNGVIEWQ
ncbi:MAG: TolC family protein [Fibrobacter sp.]|nr:TolC family protein [Fibrobacter sp.]